jgi:hypothetical protein
MQYLEITLDWLIKNKEWFFSGIGIVISVPILNWIIQAIKTNKQLRIELASAQSWEKIQLIKTNGGAVVYKSNSEPKHYICPSCYNFKQLQILQNNHNLSGKFCCTNCNAQYQIELMKTSTQKHTEVSGHWMG